KMVKLESHNIERLIKQDPTLLTRNSYLNFLRFYGSQHPRYGWRRILKSGFKIWNKLTPEQRQQFTQKQRMLADRFKARVYRPVRRRRRPRIIPRFQMPQSYRRRSLNANRNVERNRRNYRRFFLYSYPSTCMLLSLILQSRITVVCGLLSSSFYIIVSTSIQGDPQNVLIFIMEKQKITKAVNSE
ncbi:hypothetical protein DOY81_002139, partial [Sarcophaga bullata]